MLVRKLLCRNLFCIAVLVATSFHSAYGQNRPNHADALNQIKNMLSDDNILEITKPVYVNGTQTDINHYVVAVSYTKVFKVSSKTLFDKDGMPLKNPANAADGAVTILSYLINAGSGNLYGPFEPGDSFDMTCQFIFIGTENGWVLQGAQGPETIVKRNIAAPIKIDGKVVDKAAYKAAGEKYRDETIDGCQSGKQLKVRASKDNPVDVFGITGSEMQGRVWRLTDEQIAVGVPDAHTLTKYYCHVQYTVDGKTVSGYIFYARLVIVP